MFVWLNFKTIKFNFIKLDTNFDWQNNYSLGETFHLDIVNNQLTARS